MDLQAWGQTDVGCKRDANQDSLLVRPDFGLFIVADGMGGHRGGEVASAMAVQVIQEVVEKGFDSEKPQDVRLLLQKAYRDASFRIFQRGQQDPNLRGMATTTVLFLIKDGVMWIANVGDSRAYLLDSPGIWQLTEDHSLFNEKLRAGLVKEADRNTFEEKNVITRSVGYEPDAICDVWERPVREGEGYLLCSDGLSNLVPDSDIANICLTAKKDEVVPRLIEEARTNGGDDNITALFVTIGPSVSS